MNLIPKRTCDPLVPNEALDHRTRYGNSAYAPCHRVKFPMNLPYTDFWEAATVHRT